MAKPELAAGAMLPLVLLVGGGKMGGALLAGWRESGVSAVVVVDPSPGAAVLADDDTQVFAELGDLPHGFAPEAVILAIKPQAAAAALPAYARFAGCALFISIMAGQRLSAIAAMLGADAAIIRAMPNTPAAVGQGFTVATANSRVSDARRVLAHRLLAAGGEVAWVEDEALLDPVTAISGGGPAYLFLLVELLEQAALTQGIPAGLARAMARKTIIGGAALLAASVEDAAALRIAVTSPGGTTERALAILRADDALPALFGAAIEAATRRSRELSGGEN